MPQAKAKAKLVRAKSQGRTKKLVPKTTVTATTAKEETPAAKEETPESRTTEAPGFAIREGQQPKAEQLKTEEEEEPEETS